MYANTLEIQAFDIFIYYTPQNNWRTNTFNYNFEAFCVERISKTDFTI